MRSSAALLCLSTVAFGLFAGGCSPASSSDVATVELQSASASTSEVRPVTSSSASARASETVLVKRQRDGEGRCTPMPRVGEPCAPGESYCVVDWGQPGGSSRAFWCRKGEWHLEEEANLP
ncbi:MAG: hypothetical protein U0271_26835 [Polyangiaceae bacterium]